MGVAISVLALYTYTIIYIFNHDMEEIFATFIMLVIYSPFFPLFLISVGGLSLLD
ncbi:putative membrane protein [Streptococcus mitis]|uniref:Putative membrane protein n=1 Tax=Streptococcus mitis TaxID=28037 RepID=A0A081PRJ0_STRMT|nr:putative membrane protein [Streptococcus mitis]